MRRLAMVLFALSFSLSCFAITIKLGSIAPVGSPWDLALRRLAAEWDRVSGGTVKLKIYLGGIAGDEPDILRKIRFGQLQAAAITAVGLHHIAQDILILSTPFLIRSEEELDYVLEKTRPDIVEMIRQDGLEALSLEKVTWVYFFSKEPVVYPADLKRQKLSVTGSDATLARVWRKLGYKVVSLELPDVAVALRSGMIDAFYFPPIVTAGYQWFAITPYMTDLRVAPVIGGVVISSRAWSQISDDIKPQLLAALREYESTLYAETQALESKAMATMKEHGLVPVAVSADAAAQWYAEMDQGMEELVGEVFSRETYEMVMRHIRDFRRTAQPR